MSATIKTLRRVEEVLRDYHPEFGDDFLSANQMKKQLTERGWSTDPSNIKTAMEYLVDKGIAEKDQKSDSNFEGINPYDVYRIIDE